MIRFLENFCLRFCLIIILVAPLCFYCMPLLSRLFPGVHQALPFGFLLIFLGGITGATLDFIGKKKIEGLIKEGEIWERTSIFPRAEKAYSGAVRVYGSFLLSPFFSRKIATRLTRSLTRFSLTSGIETPCLKIASAVYLKSNPGDETLAGLWLEQIKKDGTAGTMEQEVLTALADIHYNNKVLRESLAAVLLDLGRMDYSAKRVYKVLLDDSQPVLETKNLLEDKIHGLLGEPGEPSETLGNKINSRVIPTKNSKNLGTGLIGLGLSFFTIIVRGVKRLVQGLSSILSFCILSSGRLIALFRERERLGFYVRAGAMGMLSLWLLFFMGNTISHILKSRDLNEEPRIEIRPPKPFTIQVAAYLKQAHADRYAEILNKKGVAPFIAKVQGGGKTWYVVRISEFSDKASAAAFGKKLKTQKIIEDFFVSNR
jgi:hypothetical protein